MAKWARRSGGRRRWQWVIEYVPREEDAPMVNGQLSMVNEEEPTPEAITPGVKGTEPDPFEHDDPADIRAALARLDQRLLECAIIGEAPG